jgi:site-specific recombinase XerD
MEIDKSRGEWLDPVLGQVTVGAWISEWFGNLAHLKPSTRSRYDVAIRNQIQPVREHVPLNAVHHGDVVRWASQLTDAGLAPSTVRYAYRVFSQALQAAVRDNRIAKNPAAYVRLPRVDPTEKRFLGHEQVETLA